MDSRKFNTIMPTRVNYPWAARVLSMNLNQSNEGIDLFDRFKGVEIKTGLTPQNWTFDGEQVNYGCNGNKCYALLMVYGLAIPVSKIHTEDIRELERMVFHRECELVGWDWVISIPISKQKKHSTYAYPYLKYLPPVTAIRKVNKGIINFRGDVNPKIFKL